MNADCLIDVIIPVKERYELLLNALNSVDKQTLKPNKVWIIDDCSSEKIEKFPKYSFNIEIIRNTTNKGPSYSCNLGAKKSNAKYIAILETDDIWKTDKLYRQYELAKKNDLDFVYCNYTINKKKNTQKFSDNKDTIFELLLKKWSCPNPSTFFFKRSSFIDINGFDESMIGTHDHDLWMKISQSNLKLNYVDDYLVEIEDYNQNQMSRDYKTRIKSITYFTSKHRELIISSRGLKYFNHYKKELISRALIPCLKKIFYEKDILGFIVVIRYLIFSKIFYRRVKDYFKR